MPSPRRNLVARLVAMMLLGPTLGDDEIPTGEEIELATKCANTLRWLLMGRDASEGVDHA